MIINLAHTKGGVGKTTIAINLAITIGASILDLDLQGSSLRFSEIRKTIGLPDLITYRLTNGFDDEILSILNQYKDNPSQHLIIDSGGMDNDVIREGLVYSDIIITPVNISPVEFYGLEDFNRLLGGEERESSYVLINGTNKNSKKTLAYAVDFIKENFPKFKVLNTVINNRVIFKEAFGEGKSVIEFDPKHESGQQILNLCHELNLI